MKSEQSAPEVSLKLQAAYLMGGRSVGFVVRLLLPVFLVRLLTQDDYGAYGQLLLLNTTAAVVLEFGTLLSLQYFFTHAKDKLTQLLSQTYFWLVGIGLIAAFVVNVFRDYVGVFFGGEMFSSVALPMSLLLLFTVASAILDYIFILERRSRSLFAFVVGNDLARGAMIALAAYAGGTAASIIWALAAFAGLRAVALCVYLLTKYGLRMRNWNRQYFWRYVHYTLPLGAAATIGVVSRRIDRLMLSALLTASSYAVYSVAAVGIPMIDLLYTSLGHVVFPRVSEHGLKGECNAARELWHKTIEAYALITIPFVILFEALAGPIIQLLFTKAYASSVAPYRVLILTFLVRMLSYGTIPRGFGHTRFVFVSNLASLGCGAALGYWLISRYDVVGAAWAAFAAVSVNGLLQIYKAKSILGLSVRQWLPWRRMASIAVVSLAVSPIPLLISTLNLHKLAVIAVGGGAYLAVIAALFMKFDLGTRGVRALLGDLMRGRIRKGNAIADGNGSEGEEVPRSKEQGE